MNLLLLGSVKTLGGLKGMFYGLPLLAIIPKGLFIEIAQEKVCAMKVINCVHIFLLHCYLRNMCSLIHK
jgi:hypothetical protein